LKTEDDDEGNIVGIASTRHKQISWNQIRLAVEDAIQDVFKTVPEVYEFTVNHWAYKMRTTKYVSSWADVLGGNNLIVGRSGIKISLRMRTETGFGTAPACRS